MLKITLEFLQEKKACSDGIKYFKTLEKQEWELVELIKKCCDDMQIIYADWLLTSLDNVDDLKDVVKFYKSKGFRLDCVFECCKDLIKEAGLEYFKSLVDYQSKGFRLDCVFECCQDLIKEAGLEYFKELVKHQQSKGWSLSYVFKHYQDLIKEVGLEYFKELVKHQQSKDWGLGYVNKHFPCLQIR